MKQKRYEDIALFDFEMLCKKEGIKQYTYLTSQQKHDSILHTITLKFTGKVMDVQYNPGQVVFLGESGELRFVRVKYVRVYHTSSEKCLHYGIICGSHADNQNNIEYRMTALN